jgi:hypothetical protein
LNFTNHDKNVDLSNSLHIFHQNVRGLRSKSDELINSFEADNINPHILCFSEHHMEEQDLQHLTLAGYILGSSFCHKNLRGRGECIFVCKDLKIKTTDSSHDCKEQDLEICAAELETEASKLII